MACCIDRRIFVEGCENIFIVFVLYHRRARLSDRRWCRATTA